MKMSLSGCSIDSGRCSGKPATCECDAWTEQLAIGIHRKTHDRHEQSTIFWRRHHRLGAERIDRPELAKSPWPLRRLPNSSAGRTRGQPCPPCSPPAARLPNTVTLGRAAAGEILFSLIAGTKSGKATTRPPPEYRTTVPSHYRESNGKSSALGHLQRSYFEFRSCSI
jgi:hypothetical protein